jgi:CheY-like chemotaxis protein
MDQPTILLVDDDVDVLQTTALMLSARGYRTVTATNGNEAVEICRRDSEHIAAVIADLSIPGDHSQYTQVIAAQFPSIKIIYATGIPRHIALSAGLVKPDAPYLEKPINADLLDSLIHSQVTKFIPARDLWE